MWRKNGLILAILLAELIVVVACGGGGGGGGGTTNIKPVAIAGRDMNALKDAVVILDGSASSDADGNPLTYNWTIISRPPGSSATLTNSSNIAPTFTTDVSGTYTIGLVVSDGMASSATDTVNIFALSSVSNLHDTGVNKCYNNSTEISCPNNGSSFYGQDAHYSTHPMQLVDNGSTVTDTFTGLMWQKNDPVTQYNWYQASGVYDATYNPATINICGSSNLGGYTDWRLPSRRELVSIMNYAQGGPDQAYFPGSGSYWSTTKVGYPSATNAWIVYSGLVGAAGGFNPGNALAAPYTVKCVRGTPWGVNNFMDNGNGTVTDATSGLQWQTTDDGIARNWQDALSWCENLTYAGSSDWRLPDIKELESLVYIHPSDYTLPLTSASFMPSVEVGGTSFYWSSTTAASNEGAALGVDFSTYGNAVSTGGNSKSNFKFTRCVR